MADEIIKELWAIKDDIAREHGHDMDALVSYFRNLKLPEGRKVVDLRATKAQSGADAAPDLLTPR